MSASDPVRGLTQDPERVSFVQNALWTLGYVPGSIDGVYGPRTIEAVRGFQRNTGLDPTGQVDLRTWDAMAQLFANELSETTPGRPGAGRVAAATGRTAPDTPVSITAVLESVDEEWAPDTPLAMPAVIERVTEEEHE